MPTAEELHNSAYRQKKIVEILKMLHEGGKFEDAKRIFDETFSSVDVSEITSAERELIATGLNPMEIQNLCNVHASVFKGAIKNDQTPSKAEDTPGHPIATMKLENMVLTSLLDDELLPVLKRWQQSPDSSDQDVMHGPDEDQAKRDAAYLKRIQNALKDLMTIDHHYARKENLIFPLMDKYGITAPPKVMWGVDDEIRGWIKTAYQLSVQEPTPTKYDLETAIEKANKEIQEMIFKEEQIMLPMVDEVFTPDDWGMIAAESKETGYTLIPEPLPWQPTDADRAEAAKRKPSKLAKELNEMALAMQKEDEAKRQVKVTETANSATETKTATAEAAPKPKLKQQRHVRDKQARQQLKDKAYIQIDENSPAKINFPTGTMDLAQLTNVLSVLPVDVTFVDDQDIVRWFSDNGDRVFPRTKAVIGRAVVNCHPPKSMDKVQKILDDFRDHKNDHADFWINLHGEKFVYIRYFAVRDSDENYLGCLEVSQDVTEIRNLEGEKRL
ncbi:DUF438 domain-containing protein [Agrilactobacillus fermenti]|uniref:DUF438 domain-containing protein n=1 Tax=Agrilactobacillus fermenti TaxID=2586909 RepID=UPI003A5C0344